MHFLSTNVKNILTYEINCYIQTLLNVFVEAVNLYEITGSSGHYGSEERMIADIWTNLRDGDPLPVSPRDALIAGLTAPHINEARGGGKAIDCRPLWDRFDAARGQSERCADAELSRC